MTNATRPTCPDCQSLMVPYLYGYPSGPPPEDGGPDDYFIAGCLIGFLIQYGPSKGERGEDPKWGCRACYNLIREDDAD